LRADGITDWLDRVAVAATLALPVFIMHGRGVAEALIGVVDLTFLLRCLVAREWGWLRTPWVTVAATWWGWVVLCSLPLLGAGGIASLLQAIALVRFLLLVAALEHVVLASPNARRWLQRVLTAAALYIGLQTLLQATTGRDIQGFRRSGDGELTGPFEHARAAAPLSRLMFPALLPPVAWLLQAGTVRAVLLAGALTAASLATIVLIGQRMPLVLTIFGLIVSGLMLPRLRPVVAAAIAAGLLLVGASVAVSPPTYYRLVTKLTAQISDFPDSPYGLIAARALTITAAHPLFGQGFDGFRNACPDPRYFRKLPGQHIADGGGAAICNIHPHSHYLEAATEAGVPGLLLFCALVVIWLRGLLRGIRRDLDDTRVGPLRVGLFVAALLQEWPIATASSFTAVEIGGFFFLLLGFGLAQARYGGCRGG
jgi:O-antigen ligase